MADTSLNIVFREEPISIQQGDDVEITFTAKTALGANVNLASGYTAVLRSRVAPGDTDPVIDLASGTGLTLGNGTIVAALSSTVTAALASGNNTTYELVVTKTDGGGTGINLSKTIRRGTVNVVAKWIK